MTALPYQPVPTLAQQRRLRRWVDKTHPIRQYEQTQALISPVEAAGVACCDVTDEPPVMLAEAVSIIAKGFACIAGWLAFGFGVLWLCDLAGQYFGGHA
ncbi:hypothetical protein [Frateuria terrea]|uniref:Uncharacterized protein n=1 Tax=Frateuria terrea TaxID=529704 RepID=A0A1H6ZS51_9GAMM|nr:hypothetical protein [Frateuria terrea]SEJ54994.1 hypothetical protein SAMN04487997_0179 [Frateuria terrea]SFP47504.1 hypothetical protein SAMN02927913_2211 [Frateuria terrea]